MFQRLHMEEACPGAARPATKHSGRAATIGLEATPAINQRGFQPSGASSKPLNSKPGATVQPHSVQSPVVSAACQACAASATA